MTDYLNTDAVLSKDGVYRFVLHRQWKPGDKRVVWIMLNPSTADASVDDPTIRRCVQYSKDWGMDGLTVVNLWPLRTPDPDVLFAALRANPEPKAVFDMNIGYIDSEAYWNNPELVVCGWGTKGAFNRRNKLILDHLNDLGAKLSTLRLTEDRHPSHPLYLPKTLKPLAWNGK